MINGSHRTDLHYHSTKLKNVNVREYINLQFAQQQQKKVS